MDKSYLVNGESIGELKTFFRELQETMNERVHLCLTESLVSPHILTGYGEESLILSNKLREEYRINGFFTFEVAKLVDRAVERFTEAGI